MFLFTLTTLVDKDGADFPSVELRTRTKFETSLPLPEYRNECDCWFLYDCLRNWMPPPLLCGSWPYATFEADADVLIGWLLIWSRAKLTGWLVWCCNLPCDGDEDADFDNFIPASDPDLPGFMANFETGLTKGAGSIVVILPGVELLPATSSKFSTREMEDSARGWWWCDWWTFTLWLRPVLPPLPDPLLPLLLLLLALFESLFWFIIQKSLQSRHTHTLSFSWFSVSECVFLSINVNVCVIFLNLKCK